MNKELENLLLYFKTTDEPHSEYAKNLIQKFANNLDDLQKQRINEIVTTIRKKSSKYYKNYDIAKFIKAYIFNKNNGRNVGSLNDYIQHYKHLYG